MNALLLIRNVLGLSLLSLPGRRAIILGTHVFAARRFRDRRLQAASCSGFQIILKPFEKFFAHPFNCRAQTVRLLTLGWTRSKVHQVAEQIFGSLPPVLHHENDRPLLFFGKRKASICQDALHSSFNSASGFAAVATGPCAGEGGCWASSGPASVRMRKITAFIESLEHKNGRTRDKDIASLRTNHFFNIRISFRERRI